MLKIWTFIKNAFTELRDFFWFYPYFFVDHNELVNSSSIWRWYMRIRPFSIIFTLLIFFTAIFMLISNYGINSVKHSNTIIEGLVKDPSFDGNVSVNPIIGSTGDINTNLEKIIYESLFKIKPNGDIAPLLSESYQTSPDGKSITINLRTDVYWHDGEKFTSDDVIETFRRLKNSATIDNVAAQTIQNTTITKLDDYSLTIAQDKPIANFLELINIGIMPKHILTEVTLNNLQNHPINSAPIGTGPFKFINSNPDNIQLTANTSYWGGKPKTDYYQFNLYNTEKDVIIALKSGQINLFNNVSAEYINDIEQNKNISLIKSIPIYRQYWALYFNLNKDSTVYKDAYIRQAVSYAIDKTSLVNNLSGLATPAKTTIPDISWVNPKSTSTFDISKANKLLDDNGWVLNQNTHFREKNGKQLSLDISYLDTGDKNIVVNSIKSNLNSIGININLIAKSADDMKSSVIPNRDFDLLLSGVETSSDPDRIRFWHEDAIQYPGLNLSGYVSSIKIKDPITGTRTSRVDDILVRGLATSDRTLRSEQYQALVKILDTETPAVFLYYPIMLSAVNKRITNFDTSNITIPEDRYQSLSNWKISN